MTQALAGVPKAIDNTKARFPLWNGLAVLLGALFMAWPAIYNGFPLLYPDSMTYIDDGRIVARAVFLHQLSDYYGMRSFIYSMAILPLHWNVSVWPVAAAQCLLTAWILWLVVRSIAPRQTILPYFAIVLPLSLFTGMSWYATMIMPDILGPLLYLSIYLLVFARDTLRPAERWALYAIAWWGVTAHSTHLMLAAGLLLVLAARLAAGPRGLGRLRPFCEVAAIVALAATAELALHDYLYGTPSLNGERPPYLTARLIEDGPGRWYLEKHCGTLKWVICDHLQNLSGDADNFLWGADGVYQTISESDSKRLVSEEVPFALATLRAYPREQIGRSAANFWGQLATFGFEDLDASGWVLDQFATALPRARSSYVKSLQAQNALPLDMLTSIQNWAVMASLAILAVFAPLLWRRHSAQIAGLCLVIVFTVVANAFVMGVLSMVEDRLQCRVVWLVPLLAGMCALDWISQRQTSKPANERPETREVAATH